MVVYCPFCDVELVRGDVVLDVVPVEMDGGRDRVSSPAPMLGCSICGYRAPLPSDR